MRSKSILFIFSLLLISTFAQIMPSEVKEKQPNLLSESIVAKELSESDKPLIASTVIKMGVITTLVTPDSDLKEKQWKEQNEIGTHESNLSYEK